MNSYVDEVVRKKIDDIEAGKNVFEMGRVRNVQSYMLEISGVWDAGTESAFRQAFGRASGVSGGVSGLYRGTSSAQQDREKALALDKGRRLRNKKRVSSVPDAV